MADTDVAGYSVRVLLLLKALELFWMPGGESTQTITARPRNEYDAVLAHRNVYVLTSGTAATLESGSPFKMFIRLSGGHTLEIAECGINTTKRSYVMQCPNCTNEVLAGEMFCENCGHALSSVGDPPLPPVTPQPEIAQGDLAPPPPPVTPDPAQLVEPVQPPPPPVVPVMPPPPAVIEQEQPAVSPQIPEVSIQAQPRMMLKDGSAEFKLKTGTEILVGRLEPGLITPDIDLTPHDPDTGVSRRHAIIHEQGGQWFIKDHDSTNYTLVNRSRLTPHQDFLIEDGDEVRFGRVITTFRTT